MKTNGKKAKRWLWTGLAAVCALIWSVTNFGYDCGYQLAMSYRFLQGDRMFVEMWEPHQMSVFLPAALMWVYLKLIPAATGIVVYLQACGLLIRGGLAYCLYRTFRDDLDEPLAYGMGLFYFMISPKDYAVPDFSNQQLWYVTLLFCALMAYLKKGKLRYLFGGAVSLCLGVMAYPSCAIILVGVLFLLFMYSLHRGRDIWIFAGTCAALGIVFCLITLPDVETLKVCLAGMLALEPSHTVSAFSKLFGYFKDIVRVSLLALAALALGLGISLPVSSVLRKKGIHTGQYWVWLSCCGGIFLAAFLANILSVEHRDAYGIIFLCLVALGLRESGILQGKKKQLYVCGSVIGCMEFLATLLLTDLWLTVSVTYGLLAILAALIPLTEKMKEADCAPVRKWLLRFAQCFVFLLALRCAYIRTPLTGYGQICSSFSDLSIVRSGPAFGLVSNEVGVCIQRDTYPEWQELIREGDNVWIVGGLLDNLEYLYGGAQVAGPTTMSTPSYNDAILEYWRLNPDKYPDVVVAVGYLGELTYELQKNEWLMNWLEKEFRPAQVVEGTFWIYYFREKRE